MKKIALFALLWMLYPVAVSLYAQNNRTTTNNVQDMDIFYHTIESGQTVYSIAKMYDVMVIDIHKLNPGSENSIRAGERLRIPQRRFEVKSILNVNNTKTDNDYIIHTIQANETLYGLSRRYDVSQESILKANPGLTQANFSIGKRINIPRPVVLQPSAEVVVREGAREVYYKVPTDETIYNICRQFKTTESELLQLNPELAGGLHAGMTIRIPLRISESELSKKFETETKTVTPPPSVRTLPKNAPKIALILPFISDNPKSKISRMMTEYYAGLLLALDTMRKQGLVLELFTYESDTSIVRTRRLIQEKSEELKKVDLIIGGYFPEEIKLIANFAKQNEIKYIIPFSASDEFVRDNAFVFQVNTPTNFLNTHAAFAGANLFGKHNIIILETNDTLPHTEFIRAFKQELKDRFIAYKDAVYSDAANFETDILALLSDTKPNVILPVSQSVDALLKIKTILRMIAETQPEYNLTLFGYPRWQTEEYLDDCLEDFHVLNAYIYSRLYVDNIHPNVKSFYEKYKNWYNRTPVQDTPIWAILGYDTAMFFFNAILQFGVNFEDRLSEINYRNLQTGFNFIRINDEGGFINSNIFIIHYNKDFTISHSAFK